MLGQQAPGGREAGWGVGPEVAMPHTGEAPLGPSWTEEVACRLSRPSRRLLEHETPSWSPSWPQQGCPCAGWAASSSQTISQGVTAVPGPPRGGPRSPLDAEFCRGHGLPPDSAEASGGGQGLWTAWDMAREYRGQEPSPLPVV